MLAAGDYRGDRVADTEVDFGLERLLDGLEVLIEAHRRQTTGNSERIAGLSTGACERSSWRPMTSATLRIGTASSPTPCSTVPAVAFSRARQDRCAGVNGRPAGLPDTHVGGHATPPSGVDDQRDEAVIALAVHSRRQSDDQHADAPSANKEQVDRGNAGVPGGRVGAGRVRSVATRTGAVRPCPPGSPEAGRFLERPRHSFHGPWSSRAAPGISEKSWL